MNTLHALFIISTIITYPLFSGNPSGRPNEAKRDESVVETQSLQLIDILGNKFRLGDIFNDGGTDEMPISYVILSDFRMSKYEVTVAQFSQFVTETQYVTEAEKDGWAVIWDGTMWSKDYGVTFRNPGFPQSENHPVICVSWNDAVAYCQWMSKQTKTTIRLPTEAEWEFAARERGMRPRYGWGNGEPSGNVADETAGLAMSNLKVWSGYRDGFAYTAPVGAFRANEIGLHDMSGNVLEWCADSYSSYTKEEKTNPLVRKETEFKVLRGGSWFNGEATVRTTTRTRLHQSYRGTRVGFRIVQLIK
ncbi:MAG: formylglycine-generating enzyme family protein [Bacteriovoracaceae bacterium]|nr:formylglycine-generating enzyme family protein [Bacteroidota bacterium]